MQLIHTEAEKRIWIWFSFNLKYAGNWSRWKAGEWSEALKNVQNCDNFKTQAYLKLICQMNF